MWRGGGVLQVRGGGPPPPQSESLSQVKGYSEHLGGGGGRPPPRAHLQISDVSDQVVPDFSIAQETILVNRNSRKLPGASFRENACPMRVTCAKTYSQATQKWQKPVPSTAHNQIGSRTPTCKVVRFCKPMTMHRSSGLCHQPPPVFLIRSRSTPKSLASPGMR